MSNITVLDQQTINKIAAGEVVERPAAVVKELVENSIDAGANAVTVEIKEGGIGFIRITDNGSGIRKDDIKVAFLRHATSKIKSVEDLLSVSSLGFRGEALSSISAVAQVELVTKNNADLLGSRYLIDGGEEKGFEEIGSPEGTTFVIRNLFYNTPARRKFLKSATTEAGYISDLIERLAISHPNISFKFLNNNQLKLTTSGNNKLKDIIYQIYGRDVAANLLEVEGETDHMSVHGFIGKPTILRGNRNHENYYINGRYIKSPIITRAIEDAYKPFVMHHKYPFTCLHFDIDPLFIDVNVHPTKMELRLRNGEEAYKFVHDLVSRTLKQQELITDISLSAPKKHVPGQMPNGQHVKGPEPFEKKRIEASNKALEIVHEETKGLLPEEKVKESFLFEPTFNLKQAAAINHKPLEITEIEDEQLKEELLTAETVEAPPVKIEPKSMPKTLREEVTGIKSAAESNYSQAMTSFDIKEITSNEASSLRTENEVIPQERLEQVKLFEEQPKEEKKPSYRIIGQLFETYWMIEFENKLLMIDQHAAHEKVLYEKLLHDYDRRETLSQGLLPPIVMTLNSREEDCLKLNMEIFNDLGFEIDFFGGREYAIKAVPANLYGLNEQSLFVEMLDTLIDEDSITKPTIVLEKVASMSCKAAIKGNQKINYHEFKVLLDDLMGLENPYFCPHGRPIIISMSKYEVEKKFKRIL
ncbi:MAG: DNA mismatch repair endonuclease MutL [bacterium]|nr:DNA mismatch repair endonuclease MutL [bacterium]